MTDSIERVERFLREVWASPQNPDVIDEMLSEDFVLVSGGRDIVSRAAFKEWVQAFYATVDDMDFEIIETFESADGRRVASRWRLTGRNRGLMGTEANGARIYMVGTAVWEIGEDGLLRRNWVERNAWEVFGQINDKSHAF
jgi:hypothetical protein